MKEFEQEQVFKEWLADHKGLLFRVVHAYAFTAEDKDDLFQEICLQAWNSIPNFRQQSGVSTWLYRIALNTAIKWSKRLRKHEAGRQPIGEVAHLLRVTDHPVDERLAWLYEEIAHLGEIDRSLTLLLLDGFSYKEMSAMLGISESHVGVKLHRIKQMLVEKAAERFASPGKEAHHGI